MYTVEISAQSISIAVVLGQREPNEHEPNERSNDIKYNNAKRGLSNAHVAHSILNI